jgi:hypothetical protein
VRFPQTEPEIAALALKVIQGLMQAADDFPSPPVSATELQGRLDRYNAALGAAVAGDNASREQHAVKDEALRELAEGVKRGLKYAELVMRGQPEKLSKLGWGPRRAGATLTAPCEVRDIQIVAEGDTWAILRWKPPVDGGDPGYYRIQRKQDGTPWEDAGTTTETERLMSNQPRGVRAQLPRDRHEQGGQRAAERHGHAGAVAERWTPRAWSGDYCGNP